MKLLKLKEVLEITACGKTKLYAMIKKDEFTRPCKIGASSRWRSEEVENWIKELQAPYPLLMVDMDWTDRFPETVRQINEKNIPVGLLGDSGTAYEESPELLASQLKRFEKTFGVKPLWFRTIDERFPQSLQKQLWKAEVNALGSSFIWTGGAVPPPKEGEIISIPHHRHERVKLNALDPLYKGRTFRPVEDVLFGTTVKTKKIPE